MKKIKQKKALLQKIVLFLILILGVIYLHYTWKQFKNDQANEVLQIARSIEITLPKENLKTLKAKPNDIDMPQYKVIKNTLKSIISVNPKARFAYIYTKQNGKIHFIADSEPAESKDYSPPGQEYTEADMAYSLPFDNGKEFVTGSVTDRWGTWISVLIPIKDEVTGKTIAVFAMDFNAKSWDTILLFKIIESGTLIVLLLLAFLFLFIINAKNEKLKDENTKQKLTENELRKSEEKYRTIFENVQDVFYQTDLTGIVLEISPSIKYFSEFVRDEIIGTPVHDLYYNPDDRNALLNAIMKNGELRDYELKLKTKTGIIKHVSINARLILDGNGNPNHIDGAIRDITERKRIEEELIIAKEKAEESDRLKSAFLSNMSHEIRTPMNGILGFAELLKEPNLTGEEQQEYIGIIEKSGTRMLNIINDIIDISKIESGLMKILISETNINEQIEYIHTFFKPEINAKNMRLYFKNNLSSKKAVIKTDREKIYAILTNLVKNAIKFTHSGCIEFGYNLKPAKPKTAGTSGYLFEPYELEFFVKDTGTGIRQEQLEIVFERFRQGSESLTRSYEGAGLGLSISKTFVEMLGGKIWVESELGKGSVFYFTIPYNGEQDAKEVIQIADLNDDKEKQIESLKILIAEDDEISARLLTKTIKIFSKEILKAKTGIEAVKACRNNPDIDLILMDIQMPEMDGYETTRQIRQFNKDVIIIAQTAYALTDDREKAKTVRKKETTKHYINKASAHIEENSYRDCLMECRRALENLSNTLWHKASKKYNFQISYKVRSPNSPPDLMGTVNSLKKELTALKVTDFDNSLKILAWLAGLETTNNQIWNYLNKGTHEESDRDDFDSKIVQEVLENLIQLETELHQKK